MARRALLLGVDDYGDPGLELSAPANDVDRLADTLTRLVGYAPAQVRALVSSRKPPLTTNTLRREIDRFCKEAEPGDDLLVYFSGHGIEWQGHRLLVPQDYFTDDPRPRGELLGDSDLYALARRSPARQVLFVIDACRDGVHLEVVADKAASADAADPAAAEAEGPTVAVLYSCATGTSSYATTGAQAFSYFTRAFADALGEEGEAATLGAVMVLTQTALERLLPADRTQRIRLDERPNIGRAGAPAGLILREDQAARLRQRMAESPWCQALTAGPLWPLLAGEPEGLRDQVRAIALESEDLVRRAALALPDQRWRDSTAPTRVIQRLAQVLRHRPGECLSGADAAVAIAVPHVYEAVLAAAELALVGAPGQETDPLDPEALARAEDRLARTLRERYLSETAWARRRALLVRRGLEPAARDLAAWQLNRFLHESGEVWDWGAGSRGDDPGLAALHAALARVLSPAPLKTVAADPRIDRLLDPARLVALARLLFAGFDEIEQQRAPGCTHPLEPWRPFGEGEGAWSLEEVKLAHLLRLAAGLALDARRLPPLIPEHLGLAEEIAPARVHATLAQCTWQPDGDGLALTLVCPHEAIDAALREQVRALDAHLHRLARGEAIEVRRRAILPAFLSDRLLEPERRGGQPRYRTDHLAFSLDQGRVRELLMGESLYGRPELALRELYQNALDACRYRRARDRWLRATGRRGDETPPYRGLIEFRAGEDQGRRWIECRDNGVGMAERHLRTLFAKAGSRFADTHEFHLELADWEAAGVRFWPNSRFGIGVFSYFMLADEVLIESQRDRRHGGGPETGLRALVSGSGGLFRIQETNDLDGPGTRVRLYLGEGHEDTEKLLEGIPEWLWVPEFETRIQGGETRVLEAGEPGPVMVKRFGAFAPIPESAGDAGQCRVWWHGHDDGTLLVDGLQASLKSNADTPRRDPLKGLVINLTESVAPELSVDRSRITRWDLGKQWVKTILDSEGWVYLSRVPAITLAQLAELCAHHPKPMRMLDNALRTGSIPCCEIRSDARGDPVRNTSIGICPADAFLKDPYALTDAWDLNHTLRKLLRGRLQDLNTGAELGYKWSPFVLLQEFDAARNWPSLPAHAWWILRSLPIGLGGVLAHAADQELSREETRALLESLRTAGIAVPELEIPPTIRLDRRERVLLSAQLNGQAPWLDSLPISHMAWAAQKWSLPLARLTRAAGTLATLGVGTPCLDPLPDLSSISESAWRLWSRWPNRDETSLLRELTSRFLNEIPAFHLFRSAYEWRTSLDEIRSAACSLETIGVPIPDLNRVPGDLVLDDLLVSLLPPVNLSDTPEASSIHIGTLLASAVKHSLSLGEVYDRAQALGVLGFSIPTISAVARHFAPTRDHVRLLSRHLGEIPPWLDSIHFGQLLGAAERWRVPLDRVRAECRPLEDIGIAVAPVPVLAMCKLEDRRLYSEVKDLMERSSADGRTLTAWDLCQPMWDDHNSPVPPLGNPADYREALGVLADCGMDVSEALAFADFCAARSQGSAISS